MVVVIGATLGKDLLKSPSGGKKKRKAKIEKKKRENVKKNVVEGRRGAKTTVPEALCSAGLLESA